MRAIGGFRQLKIQALRDKQRTILADDAYLDLDNCVILNLRYLGS